MSQPGQQPFFDPANPLLAQVPVRLDAGTVTEPGKDTVGVLTMRSASASFTAILSAEDTAAWGKIISDLAASMTGSGPGLAMPSPAEISLLGKGNGKRELA